MQINQIVNVDLVKQMNSAVVYKLIDRQGPISRIQISELSQLAPASVTKITRNNRRVAVVQLLSYRNIKHFVPYLFISVGKN